MKPDARNHNPDPEYIRDPRTGLTQEQAGQRIGIPARPMRYLSRDAESYRPAPYCVQYTLEQLVERL